MRQGLLSEPQASSGPAAMLLAVSRSPSSIPRRSPCLERCHLPLASLYTSTSQNPKNIPDCIHSRSDATFLWRPSTTSTSQNLKNIPDCIHSRSDATFLWRPSTTSTSQNLKKHPRLHPLPERCHLPLAFLNHIHLTKPQTYPRLPPMLRADVKKISRTDMRLRHSLSLAFRKKLKCIILIDKRIKTSAAV